MADLLEELERMAANGCDVEDISTAKIEQWQRLFGFSHTQARTQIGQHRDRISRQRVSDELWQLVREESEACGHDRESYEFSIQYKAPRTPNELRPGQRRASCATYIVQLESPIETAQKVQTIAKLKQTPPVFCGNGDTGTATFCQIDGQTLQRLLDWTIKFHPGFHPTTIRLSKAPKELCDFSMAPMMGLDTTLPQNRAQSPDFRPLPAQKQWPVWYFFYGNLAKSEELQQRLGLVEPPTYVDARVYGARIRNWRGQYRALVDADPTCFEIGSAYLVASEEDEDALRFYETEKYEVVRCEIHMSGLIQLGLAFRFVGGEDELK